MYLSHICLSTPQNTPCATVTSTSPAQGQEAAAGTQKLAQPDSRSAQELAETLRLTEKLADISTERQIAKGDMDQLRKELQGLLKGKGKEADNVLRKLDRLRDIEEVSPSETIWDLSFFTHDLTE